MTSDSEARSARTGGDTRPTARIAELLEQSRQADERCLQALAELPAIRDELNTVFGEDGK